MLLLGLGIILLALKYWAVGAVAEWDWWMVLSPFALAVVWWTAADHFGYTRKKVMQREQERKQARIDRNRVGIGLSRGRR